MSGNRRRTTYPRSFSGLTDLVPLSHSRLPSLTRSGPGFPETPGVSPEIEKRVTLPSAPPKTRLLPSPVGIHDCPGKTDTTLVGVVRPHLRPPGSSPGTVTRSHHRLLADPSPSHPKGWRRGGVEEHEVDGPGGTSRRFGGREGLESRRR